MFGGLHSFTVIALQREEEGGESVICISRDPHSGVAARLDAPGTQYELDCIRPDFLLLRVRDPADP